MRAKAASLWRIVVGIVKELSDQNAYERHLRVHGRVHSGEEWRRFQGERARSKYQNPRCC
jgi:hypothetical protein